MKNLWDNYKENIQKIKCSECGCSEDLYLIEDDYICEDCAKNYEIE